MDMDFFAEVIEEYGYLAMFIFNLVTPLGVPIPNEAAAAFSGVMTEISHFNPYYAFLSSYLGLVSSNTFSYIIGRVFGNLLIQRLNNTHMKKPLERFTVFMEKHGSWTIPMSFFLPGIRWAMPFVVGVHHYPFFRYVLYAYPAGSLWMLIYFNVGRSFPYAYERIIGNLQLFLVAVSFFVILVFVGRYYYQKKTARK
ncbi:DedA family protein [Planococcus sp. N028]|uniref:DedA family protein n=1 Tax=Planococcus shixiaomingii TaxID=3058393 RepID=A0ABT8MZE6_9BACL|nr:MULTISPECIES: DedA family protein [unclassified Planococcus (in: firmicutes)]MDN7241018.1 DedA family protein [Planococcus sp. N028]WKA53272.1 DedA family protein [Planococcus sp. N022]